MKIPTSYMVQEEATQVVSSDMDYVIGKLQGKLIVESCKNHHPKRRFRATPYCIPDSKVRQNQDNKQPAIIPKCPRCLSRNCSCSGERHDSLILLKKLLQEQTLIQEAVRRLQHRDLSLKCDESPSSTGSSLSEKSGNHEENETLRNTSYDSETEWDLDA